MKHPCSVPRCGNLVEPGERRCAQHQREYGRRDAQWRGSAQERGYNHRWMKTSKRNLGRSPFCVMCLAKGIVKAARVSDHIVPVTSASDPSFFKESAIQSLCVECHAIKTQEDRERGLLR
jgi:5-methylcytosine-specific restriction enzyme A